MICETPYKEDNLPEAMNKRHTISSCRGTNIDDNVNELQKNGRTTNVMKQHWELIESYYVARLDSLQTEIEQNTIENHKLSKCRDELLKEVVRLTERSTELSLKNESLSRIIAEKENKVTAFMYQQQPEEQQQQQQQEPVGVTLKDRSTATLPNISLEEKPLPSKSEPRPKKEPGIFRQLSLRLSSKKRRQQEGNIQKPGDSNHLSDISEPALHPAMVISSFEKNSIFGKELTEQAKSEGLAIPTIVTRCIEQVELRGLNVEGIYRKSGTYQQVKDLQDAFDGECRTTIRLTDYDDISVITSVLKIYLRNLPSPLLSAEFIFPLIVNLQERINKTYHLLHTMSSEAYCTTKYLIQHLRRIHDNQAVNRMPSKNLAVVFGPTLMRFIGDIVIGNEENQMHEMIDTVDFIIMQSHVLFADYYP
ncbi:unnamed protein product [Rhizopus stolonifer]